MRKDKLVMSFPELTLPQIEKLMEEMANAPKEEMGKRQPGEKCMYEIYRKERFDTLKNSV